MSWTSVHEILRTESDYRHDEVGAMYHALARGDVRYVAHRLASSLEQADPSEWLEVLGAVTAAPRRPDHQQPLDELATLTGWVTPGDQPLASVARLVAASWIRSNPLSANKLATLYHLIETDLTKLAEYSNGTNASVAFYSAARGYKDAATESS